MSILIKDMEMPTYCGECPMLEGDRLDGLCHAASRWLDDDEYWTWYVYPECDIDDSKPCNCPLIEIPPHGRLIDADTLKTRVQKLQEWLWDKLTDADVGIVMANDVRYRIAEESEEFIDDATTIIEAEE